MPIFRPAARFAYGRDDHPNAMLEAAVAKLEDCPRKPDLVTPAATIK